MTYHSSITNKRAKLKLKSDVSSLHRRALCEMCILNGLLEAKK